MKAEIDRCKEQALKRFDEEDSSRKKRKFGEWAVVAGCISGGYWAVFLLIIYIAWLVHRGEKSFHKISETFTITASSGRSITITMLCDDWLEANNGTFVGKRTDGEKVIQAVRKMIEEKKDAYK